MVGVFIKAKTLEIKSFTSLHKRSSGCHIGSILLTYIAKEDDLAINM
ncbi:hypothetical protein [Borreliella burgdorferi]|uniref:Uncharacterized protein n=2 Tax=Borreliella burgdorferi TaxID=139 RepID=A0A7U3YBJ2_BORBG|nr:hypothetical protein [Borreliella burgdorferi]ACK74396.1 conserved hypothetical protein [Borreliella burgdorferi ZS7]ACN24089.1 conserved hypothetical protein [Borreliella burgdorferi 64b]ACN56240.1 conserved hypothetical protein [Borreliella burgdorferi CA-11.2A]ACN93065.1 conserved hypothetical protein [Borreliella burgdorferi 118a]MCS2182002.1 hypothetical protein [Borreliella burgdorferi]